LKILYCIHQFYPQNFLGTEKFLLNLATCVQNRGHRVKVISYSAYENSSYAGKADRFLWKEYEYKGIPVLAYKQKPEPPDLHWNIENPPLFRFADQMLERERPDVLHIAHGMRVGSFAIAAQRLGIPYIVTLTDFFFLCPNSKLFTSKGTLCAGPEKGVKCMTFCPEFDNHVVRNRLMMAEQILRGAHRVVAPSRFLGNIFMREYPWLKLKLIPYGVDFSVIRQNTRTYTGSGKLTVLFAGQIDIHKGVHVLIDAVRQMKSDNIAVNLYGSGPPLVEQKLKRMAGDDPRIRFCGVYSDDQMGEVFGGVDCVVIPSTWHENNTIVMREAFASHVPCIVSDAGGMAEMVKEGRNGFVVRMGDANHLRETFERLIADPAILAGTKREFESYAVSTVGQEAFAYEQLYSEAVARSGASSAGTRMSRSAAG
jgi:glycosyltransferase involved in cell wall biosynthesis